MQNKGLRTCLVVAIGLIVLVGVFAAGVGVGYVTPSLFGDTVQPTTATVCPPAPKSLRTTMAARWWLNPQPARMPLYRLFGRYTRGIPGPLRSLLGGLDPRP